MAKGKFSASLIEKGEKVGLYVCAGLMLLIVALGVYAATDVHDSSGTISEWKQSVQRIDSAIAAPKHADELPLELRGDPKQLDSIAAASARRSGTPYFSPTAAPDSKRQNPIVLAPVEGQVDVRYLKILAKMVNVTENGDRADRLRRNQDQVGGQGHQDVTQLAAIAMPVKEAKRIKAAAERLASSCRESTEAAEWRHGGDDRRSRNGRSPGGTTAGRDEPRRPGDGRHARHGRPGGGGREIDLLGHQVGTTTPKLKDNARSQGLHEPPAGPNDLPAAGRDRGGVDPLPSSRSRRSAGRCA